MNQQALGQLFGLFLFVAAMAGLFGGRRAAGAVLAGPFRFGGYVAWNIVRWLAGVGNDILRTLGRGLVQVVSDIHRHCYRRRPGLTILTYLVIFSAGALYVLLRH